MKKLLFILGLIFFNNYCFAEITAWIDNNPVVVGEVFRLHVEVKNIDDAQEPDISSINGFELLNRSEQNQTSIVGNKITRSVRWSYVLTAPSSGKFQIPSFQIGNKRTDPILVKVIASSQNLKNEKVSLDLSVSHKIVYPQQQVIVSLKIIRNGLQLVNESITPFEIDDAQIEKLKEESYQNVRKGKKFLITEILYAVIPEKSGSLVLPEIRYQGDEINGVNLGSIFQKFGSYSKNRGRKIFSKSKSQIIEVKPLPLSFKGWWLPTSNLTIEEKWQPELTVLKVGEPVTRKISIKVNGVFADQIPKLNLKYPKNIKGYADQPILKTEKTKNGLKGIRIEKWALIPGESGEIVLPEISVEWWDVSKDKLRITKLPQKIIDILPGTVNSLIKTKTLEDKIDINENVNSVMSVTQKDEQFNIWKILSVVLAFLWCGTFLKMYLNKTYKQKESKLTERNKKNKKLFKLKERTRRLKKTINSGTPESVKEALQKWSNSFWIHDPPKGLEQIGERIPELKNVIILLNKELYGNRKNENIMSDLRNEFGDMSFLNFNDEDNKENYLTQLYPNQK